ncbi:hypothetical protein AX16_001081 [Volvariella volvacea WC 439]|nr:hypothetical protein AX16_001081 [Volvariella volvacea WC 439]
MSLQLSVPAWRGIAVTLHAIADAATVFRLVHRYRLRRLWWDDYWAGIALAINIAYLTTVGLRRDPSDADFSRQTAVVVFWMTAILFPSVVWAARMSISMSIIRLVPEQTMARRLLYIMASAFFLTWMGLLFHKVGICAKTTEWHYNRAVQCYLGSTVGIVTLVTDVVSDALLIIVPLNMLRRVRLPKGQQRLLLALFSSSVFSSLAGVVYAVFVFRASSFGNKRALLISLTANVKAETTLLVCNLLVLVTYFYRTMRHGEDLESEIPPPTANLKEAKTTVYTATEMSDMPTFETTSTFDANLRHNPAGTFATNGTSRVVNTSGSIPLPTINESEPTTSVPPASIPAAITK